MTSERITINPDVMGGEPTIRGLRIPVATVVAMAAGGMTAAEIVDDLPDLQVRTWRPPCDTQAEAVREQESHCVRRLKLLLDQDLSPTLTG